MGVETSVIYHTTLTCDQCGGTEFVTQVLKVDESAPIPLPESWAWVRFSWSVQQWGGGGRNEQLLHKDCVLAYVAAQMALP